jgi:hypothetical protein
MGKRNVDYAMIAAICSALDDQAEASSVEEVYHLVTGHPLADDLAKVVENITTLVEIAVKMGGRPFKRIAITAWVGGFSAGFNDARGIGIVDVTPQEYYESGADLHAIQDVAIQRVMRLPDGAGEGEGSAAALCALYADGYTAGHMYEMAFSSLNQPTERGNRGTHDEERP